MLCRHWRTASTTDSSAPLCRERRGSFLTKSVLWGTTLFQDRLDILRLAEVGFIESLPICYRMLQEYLECFDNLEWCYFYVQSFYSTERGFYCLFYNWATFYFQFKFKRRIYRQIQTNPRKLKQINTKVSVGFTFYLYLLADFTIPLFFICK